jgi:hypothetical protein
MKRRELNHKKREERKYGIKTQNLERRKYGIKTQNLERMEMLLRKKEVKEQNFFDLLNF